MSNSVMNHVDRPQIEQAGSQTCNRALVTIVIVVYNRLQYLDRAIQSALEQTHQALQVIVVDDGSTIDPWPLVSRYGDQIEFHRKLNGGLASARNAGIDRARGEYILFLDDDDYLETHAVEVLKSAMEKNPGTVWAAGRFVYFDDAGNRIAGRESLHFESGDIYARMILESLISCPSCVLMRTQALRNGVLFDEGLRLCEDYDLWLTLARDHPIAATPEVVTNYRRHSQQISRTQWARLYESLFAVLDKHRPLARAGFDPIFDRAVAKVHFQYGDCLYLSGDTRVARAHWRLAVPTHSPSVRRRVLGRLAKSYLPPSFLNSLRSVSRAGRSILNG